MPLDSHELLVFGGVYILLKSFCRLLFEGSSKKTIVFVTVYFIKNSRGTFGFNGRLDFHGLWTTAA